nr:hypothetical transcript [Hymenolepis microstoma]
MSETSKDYEVEKILDMRHRNNGKEYLIKWLGYPDSDASWEPEILLNCPEKIKEFYRNRFKTQLHFDFSSRPSNQAPLSNRKGFARGLPVEKIVGVTKAKGEIMFLIKWKNSHHVDLVSSRDANSRCPQAIIAFYERRLSFDSFPLYTYQNLSFLP